MACVPRPAAQPQAQTRLAAAPPSLYMPPVSQRPLVLPTIMADPLADLRDALAELDRVQIRLDPSLAIERDGLERLLGPHLEISEVVEGTVEQRIARPSTEPSRAPATLVAAPEEAELLIARSPLEAASWGQEASRIEGSCEGVLRDLGEAQESGLAQLEPFLDEVDTRLWSRYRRLLADKVNAMPATISGDGACAASYAEALAIYRDCDAARTCRTTPRVFLADRLIVASPVPEVPLPEDCAAAQALAPAEEAARQASRAVVGTLDPQWSELADRMASLGVVYAALEDSCAPRRRHLDPAAVERAQGLLSRLEEDFNRSEVARIGRAWTEVDSGASRNVAGLGRAVILARFESGRGSAAERVRGVGESLRATLVEGVRCRGEDPLPLIIVLSQPGAASTSYLGYHYRESLFCPGLDPL